MNNFGADMLEKVFSVQGSHDLCVGCGSDRTFSDDITKQKYRNIGFISSGLCLFHEFHMFLIGVCSLSAVMDSTNGFTQTCHAL